MTDETFLSQLEQLVAEFEQSAGNISCLKTEDSASCAECVFCTDCERCYAARYSVRCRDSFDITHCESCGHCYACTFCKHSKRCVFSNYLIHCVGCVHCDYCLGCVGLEKKSFHILNRKYSRKAYFEIVKKLESMIVSVGR